MLLQGSKITLQLINSLIVKCIFNEILMKELSIIIKHSSARICSAKMTLVKECSLAHSTDVITECHVIVGFSPSILLSTKAISN